MLKMRSKKAQIFIVMAIAIITLFLATYEIYFITEDRRAVNKRISTMENFMFSLEKNLEREIYIFGYRGIFLAEDYIVRKGSYISNTSAFFDEAFFNGSVYGNSTEILNGVKYNDILHSVNDRANSVNIEISISHPDIKVIQKDPWNIDFIFIFNMTMKDKSDIASWDKNEIISSKVEIEGFEDPIYIVNTNAKISYRINKTIYQFGSIDSLTKHLDRNYYIGSSDAPSFLKRMQGSLAADENGIESLVDLSELSRQGLSISEKSVVDHVYFSTENPGSSQVSGMPTWFRLDSGHLAFYTGG